MRNLLRFVRFLICSSILSAVGLAQQPTAEIRGLITDASGAAVPGAAIEVVNPATGLHREAASNDSGNYVFSILPAGN